MTESTLVKVWQILSHGFEAVLSLVRDAIPATTLRIGHYSTEVFPLRAYATYSANGRNVDVSFDVRKKDGVQILADVATERGYVLEDILQVAVEELESNGMIDNAMEFVSTLKEKHDVITMELMNTLHGSPRAVDGGYGDA